VATKKNAGKHVPAAWMSSGYWVPTAREKAEACRYKQRGYSTRVRLRRVRLVVRTQPSQGWCTGSTPVRAASVLADLQICHAIHNAIVQIHRGLRRFFSARESHELARIKTTRTLFEKQSYAIWVSLQSNGLHISSSDKFASIRAIRGPQINSVYQRLSITSRNMTLILHSIRVNRRNPRLNFRLRRSRTGSSAVKTSVAAEPRWDKSGSRNCDAIKSPRETTGVDVFKLKHTRGISGC
jgi:hypothetical protein